MGCSGSKDLPNEPSQTRPQSVNQGAAAIPAPSPVKPAPSPPVEESIQQKPPVPPPKPPPPPSSSSTPATPTPTPPPPRPPPPSTSSSIASSTPTPTPPPPPPKPTTATAPIIQKEIVKKFSPLPAFTLVINSELNPLEKLYLCILHHPTVETFLSLQPKQVKVSSDTTPTLPIFYYLFVIPSTLFERVEKNEEEKKELAVQMISHINQFYNAHGDNQSYHFKPMTL